MRLSIAVLPALLLLLLVSGVSTTTTSAAQAAPKGKGKGKAKGKAQHKIETSMTFPVANVGLDGGPADVNRAIGLERLVDAGYTHEEALNALKTQNFNVDRAADYLSALGNKDRVVVGCLAKEMCFLPSENSENSQGSNKNKRFMLLQLKERISRHVAALAQQEKMQEHQHLQQQLAAEKRRKSKPKAATQGGAAHAGGSGSEKPLRYVHYDLKSNEKLGTVHLDGESQDLAMAPSASDGNGDLGSSDDSDASGSGSGSGSGSSKRDESDVDAPEKNKKVPNLGGVNFTGRKKVVKGGQGKSDEETDDPYVKEMVRRKACLEKDWHTGPPGWRAAKIRSQLEAAGVGPGKTHHIKMRGEPTVNNEAWPSIVPVKVQQSGAQKGAKWVHPPIYKGKPLGEFQRGKYPADPLKRDSADGGGAEDGAADAAES